MLIHLFDQYVLFHQWAIQVLIRSIAMLFLRHLRRRCRHRRLRVHHHKHRHALSTMNEQANVRR